MKHQHLKSLGLSVLLLALANVNAIAKGEKKEIAPVKAAGATKRVIVGNFTPPDGFQSGGASLGSAIGDMLLTALVKRGVTVIERATLNQQLDEQNAGLEGIMDEATVVETGKTLGGQVQIVGKVTQFGVKEKSGGLGGFGGGILGGVGGKKTTAEVSLDIRLVDIRTSKIIGSITGTGSESKGGFALGGGNLGSWLGGINFNSNEWTDSQLGKAARIAVEDATSKLLPLIPLATPEDLKPIEAVVTDFRADTSPGMMALRKLTFVVLIPENAAVANALPFSGAPGILGNVPNPTAETEITKVLIAAGFKIKDDARLSALRDAKWIREAGSGQLDATQIADLKNRFGADILIVGTAIAEAQAKQSIANSAVSSTGRVAARVIRMDTAQIIAIDETRSAARDTSEITAGKAALQKAATALANKLIPVMSQSFAAAPLSSEPLMMTVELEVGGLGGLKAADAFATALKGLKGVKNAELGQMKGGIAFITVEIAADKAKKLGLALEADPTLARYGLTVEDSSTEKIVAKAKPKP